MAASIELEGCTELLLTGVDDWQFDTTVFVYPGATGDAYDVSDYFGDPPGNLLQDGADYIWWSPSAQDLGRAVFTLDFFVP